VSRKVPVQPVGVPCRQIAFGLGTAVNNPVCGGSLSVVPLFGLFADFSQIDNVAHFALVLLAEPTACGADRAPYALSPAVAVNRIHLTI
jgi:hypothetical protein